MAEELGHETIQRNKDDIVTIFGLIEKIRNRPPAWASLMIAVLMAFVGSLITWVAVKGT